MESSDDVDDVDEVDTGLDRLLSLRRDAPVAGFPATWGAPAFGLFHGGGGGEFSALGFHDHPHLGVYGNDDYTPFFPVVAVSLPATPTRVAAPGLDLPEAVVAEINHSNKVEYYFLIHSEHVKGPCQKFQCDRDDEINVMLHPWVFRGCAFDASLSAIRTVRVGLFAPDGVFETHCDLEDGGVPFGRLEERTVAIHDMRFSPCNMHIRVDVRPDRPPFVFFLTVCMYADRVVLSLHCLPTSQAVASQIAASVTKKCNSLESLLEAVSAGGEANTLLLSKLCTFFAV